MNYLTYRCVNHLPYMPGSWENGEAMGWKRWITAGTVSVACLFLLIWSASAAGIQRFTDSRGVIHITNLGGTGQEPGTPGGDNQTTVPRPNFLGPENKLDKMRILGIIPPDEKPAESPEAPESETKTTPTDADNR
jgi:hypothetical protein